MFLSKHALLISTIDMTTQTSFGDKAVTYSHKRWNNFISFSTTVLEQFEIPVKIGPILPSCRLLAVRNVLFSHNSSPCIECTTTEISSMLAEAIASRYTG